MRSTTYVLLGCVNVKLKRIQVTDAIGVDGAAVGIKGGYGDGNAVDGDYLGGCVGAVVGR